MARLFDAYIVADWTAAETKKLGDTSLWIGVAKRDVRFRLYTETHNVATRAEGEALLSCVGSYRLEGLGAQLFEAVDGDYFTVLGLPLWSVLAELRRAGVLIR